MNTCIPCPPCQDDIPLTCEPYGNVSVGNRLVVEDDAFCTKTLATPSEPSTLTWDNGVKWTAFNSEWKAITSTHLAKAGEKLSVNSSGGSIIITLPLDPAQFDEIIFADQNNSWGTNNVFVNRNGSLIENVNQDLVLDTTWPIQFTMRFQGSTWRVFEA